MVQESSTWQYCLGHDAPADHSCLMTAKKYDLDIDRKNNTKKKHIFKCCRIGVSSNVVGGSSGIFAWCCGIGCFVWGTRNLFVWLAANLFDLFPDIRYRTLLRQRLGDVAHTESHREAQLINRLVGLSVRSLLMHRHALKTLHATHGALMNAFQRHKRTG